MLLEMFRKKERSEIEHALRRHLDIYRLDTQPKAMGGGGSAAGSGLLGHC